MENKNLKKNFFKFPGVISVEGKRNYAYINIADGNIFSVDKSVNVFYSGPGVNRFEILK